MRKLLLVVLLLPLSAYAEECPRIISQSPYISQTLEWMGLRDCIVGTSRYDTLGLPTTGGVKDPDARAIDELMPDLILTSDRTEAEVLKGVTPKSARGYRLYGFQSMQQISDNINTIAQAVERKGLQHKATEFQRLWQHKLKAVKGKGKKVLLLSSCSGMPYSFGRETWLYDLFTQAGFMVVEEAERIRHIRAGKEIEEITQLLDRYQPELLFIFQRKQGSQCNMIQPRVPVRIYNLSGDHFLYPSPVLLQGLDELVKTSRHF